MKIPFFLTFDNQQKNPPRLWEFQEGNGFTSPLRIFWTSTHWQLPSLFLSHLFLLIFTILLPSNLPPSLPPTRGSQSWLVSSWVTLPHLTHCLTSAARIATESMSSTPFKHEIDSIGLGVKICFWRRSQWRPIFTGHLLLPLYGEN